MRAARLRALLGLMCVSGCDSGPTPPVPAPPVRAAAPVVSIDPAAGPGHALQRWIAASSRAGAEARLSISASPAQREGKPAIAFTIRNVSGRTLQLWPSLLPWSAAHTLDLLGVATTGEAIIPSRPIDDPGPEDSFTLPPGDSRSGLAALDTLSGLDARLGATDVLVLWRYELRLDDGVGMATGAVVFRRRGAPAGVSSR